ncbi:MAG TPA: hypothetical protein VII18_04460 [Mycobacterium sp.]
MHHVWGVVEADDIGDTDPGFLYVAASLVGRSSVKRIRLPRKPMAS